MLAKSLCRRGRQGENESKEASCKIKHEQNMAAYLEYRIDFLASESVIVKDAEKRVIYENRAVIKV